MRTKTIQDLIRQLARIRRAPVNSFARDTRAALVETIRAMLDRESAR